MNGISRRTILQSSALAVTWAGGGIAPLLGAFPAAAAPMKGLIDAHCHIFNASDLPIHGFVKRVFFKIYTKQVPQQTAYCLNDEHSPPGWVEREIAEAAADLCVSLTSKAPSAADELRLLLGGAGDAAADDAMGMSESDDAANVMYDFFTAADDPAADSSESVERRKGRDDLERQLLKEAREAGYRGSAGADDPAADSAGERSPLRDKEEAKKVDYYICKSNGFFSTLVCWVRRLKAHRTDLAKEIESLFDSDDTQFALYTPALIDYSKWLQNEPRSTLADQIDVMEQISIRAGKTKFHGFAAYDPLRDIHENGAALQLAATAVTAKGFIGVKTYPPMGFKAWANAGDPNLTFPEHALFDGNNSPISPDTLKRKLDDRLEALYSWCEGAGVPILTHATNSYGSGPGYSCRADPSNWSKVVEKFPNIRVCLGHFGDFGEGMDESFRWNGNFPDGIEKTWEWHFGNLTELNGGQNFVYADVSYYSDLLRNIKPIHRKNLRDAMVMLLRKFPKAAGRLVYGTDFLLLALEPNFKEHFKIVRDFMQSVLETVDPLTAPAKLQGIFKDNAANFLGLKPGDKARARLVDFYTHHRIDASEFLNSF